MMPVFSKASFFTRRRKTSSSFELDMEMPPPPPLATEEKLGEFKIFPGFSLEFIVNKIWLYKSSPSKAGEEPVILQLLHFKMAKQFPFFTIVVSFYTIPYELANYFYCGIRMHC
jgi:hypothetical protein